jgi:hypothetical protein
MTKAAGQAKLRWGGLLRLRPTLRILSLTRGPLALAAAIAIASACAAIAQGATPAEPRKASAAEDWAWSKIQEGSTADFNKQCGELDASRSDDPGWADPNGCRTLTAAFLIDILKHPDSWKTPDAGVKIRGAKIVDDLGLEFAKLQRFVSITNTRFEGAISLDDARSENKIDLTGSSLFRFEASQFHSDSSLKLGGIRCEGKLNLRGAQFKDDLDLVDAQVKGDMDANALQVGGALHMRSRDREATFKSVSLISAKVVGDVDMIGVHVDHMLNAHSLQVGGSLVLRADAEARQAVYGSAGSATETAIDLTSAKVTGNVDMDGVVVDGSFDAAGLQIGESLLMRRSGGKSDGKYVATLHTISLGGAKIDGSLDMTGARVDRLDAPSLQVSGSVRLCPPSNDCSFQDVVLKSAKVAGDVDMAGADVAAPILLGFAKVDGNLNMSGARITMLDAPSLHVGESLVMKSVEQRAGSLAEIALGNAKIDSGLDMSRARARILDAPSLRVGGNLNLDTAAIEEVNLKEASVGGNLSMEGARITTLDASSLHVGESLLMSVERQTGGPVAEIAVGNAKIDDLLDLAGARATKLNAPSLRVGGNLNLNSANIEEVDLKEASVGGYIQVGARGDQPTIGALDLSNARAGSLLDDGKPWPKIMHLDGFTFSRLANQDMIKRSHNWWDDWARLDLSNSSYPYEQLAAAHSAAGDRDAADDFHYYERVRAAESPSWTVRPLSHVLRWGAGYGIGYYMFRALYWAIGLSLLGALFLRYCANKGIEGKHGFVWCFGASVNRLLPVLSLKKEFTEFFEDPKLNQFEPWQDFCFVALAVLGWMLGAVVLAAMGTFTRGS